MMLRIIELPTRTERGLFHVVDRNGVRQATFDSLAAAEQFVEFAKQPSWRRRLLAASSLFFKAR